MSLKTYLKNEYKIQRSYDCSSIKSILKKMLPNMYVYNLYIFVKLY